MSAHPVPTVNMSIEIAAPDGRGGWHWEPHPAGPQPEIVYTREELIKALRVFGHWASVLARGAHVRITARGAFGLNRWVGEHEWYRWRPIAEPLVHLPAWESLPFAAQLHIPRYTDHDDHKLIDSGATDVRTLRMAPITDDTVIPDHVPHVRDKEDVPHEHALPDLYGLRRRRARDRFTTPE